LLIAVANPGKQPLRFSSVDRSGQLIVPLLPAATLGIPPPAHRD